MSDHSRGLTERVRANDLDGASARLREGADPNARDPLGYPPLALAAGLGHRQMVEILIAAGADPLLPDQRMGRSPLHAAAQSGVVGVAQFLIHRGAFIDVQAPTHGHTPLIDAVMCKRLSMVRYRCQTGAVLSIRAHGMFAGSYTALDLARLRGFEPIIDALEVFDKAQAERIKLLVLHRAAKTGDLEALRAALAAGNDLDETCPVVGSPDDGHTALMIAARDGPLEIARELLDAGPRADIVDHFMKATPAHKAAVGGHAEVLALLTVHDLEIEAQGPYNGYTAMHDAAWFGHADAVRALLAVGAKTEVVGLDGRTPLKIANQDRYLDVGAALQEANPAAPQLGLMRIGET
ncbi:ankyrin repeat domain-containing protein [Lichenicoccus sp.]|uniref:ankyrin repeat domain-containing protein n=1 Tax=Lichenicoccus sp. TaxID=2781899 RepID=UPI003D0C1374